MKKSIAPDIQKLMRLWYDNGFCSSPNLVSLRVVQAGTKVYNQDFSTLPT